MRLTNFSVSLDFDLGRLLRGEKDKDGHSPTGIQTGSLGNRQDDDRAFLQSGNLTKPIYCMMNMAIIFLMCHGQ